MQKGKENSILQPFLVSFLTLKQEEGEHAGVPQVHESVLDGPSLRTRVERVVGVTDAGGDGELESFKDVCFLVGSVRHVLASYPKV